MVTQRGNKNEYDKNWLLTILFQALDQTTNPDFSLEVKLGKSIWVKGTNTDVSDIIHGFNTSFKNSVGGGIWVDTDAHDQQIISLTTKVINLSSKGTKAVVSMPNPATPDKQFYAYPSWRIKKKGDTINDQDTGALMTWCPYYKSKNGVVNGMYMPKGHNHNDWVEKRTKRQVDWNAKKNEGKVAYAVSLVNTSTNRKAVSKIALPNNFKYALVTELQLSYRETQEIVYSTMAYAANEDSGVKSLKCQARNFQVLENCIIQIYSLYLLYTCSEWS